MKKILILGAGRSSFYLISYLSGNAVKYGWEIIIGDKDQKNLRGLEGMERVRFISLDIVNGEELRGRIESAEVVISMLPAFMHSGVAKLCLELGRHLLTASYVSEEMGLMDGEVRKKGLLFLNECGLDPGIDHASAMAIIDDVKSLGGVVSGFYSYCGGLVGTESDDNPWKYKFSWNPRNVVLAGQATAHYLERGKVKYIPYNRIFLETRELEIEGYGKFEAYPNRDSLSYRVPYQIGSVKNLLRGTLRRTGYGRAWNIFVRLGWTDDSFVIENTFGILYSDLLEAFLPVGSGSLEDRVLRFMGGDAGKGEIEKLKWLGVLDGEVIRLERGSPAFLLQDLLERKWVLGSEDRDLILMQHILEIEGGGEKNIPNKIISTLALEGEDARHTAMAKTVGLPLAIVAKNLMLGEIKLRGVRIPIEKEIYIPLLEELKTCGIVFKEQKFYDDKK